MALPLLLLSAGCGKSITIPLYDSVAVLSRYPGLRGRIVTVEEYRPTPLRSEREGKVTIVGMVNYEGHIPADRAQTLRQLFVMAGHLSSLACLPQILVIRPEEDRVIVCDYYRYARFRETRQNLELRPRDFVVVPRIYAGDRVAAIEWGVIERYVSRRISRAELFQALRR